jgi:hypothetical protein
VQHRCVVVLGISSFLNASPVSMPSQVMEVAKKAFALACVEQLVPTLSEKAIEQAVFPLCLP